MTQISDEPTGGTNRLESELLRSEDGIGIVVIGRNEGPILADTLAAARSDLGKLVYVDSGSTDGSVELARSFDIAAIELDPARPFTAARGRNEGFRWLDSEGKGCRYVQFVDGDCILDSDWIERAVDHLDRHPADDVVCGVLRERNRDANRYHRLADMEWQGPLGEIEWCGGIFMVRAQTLREVGGFRDDVPAGEEPELCRRIRSRGGRITRLGDLMALHDVRMDRFSQWWQRATRAGHAYAQAVAMDGLGEARLETRKLLSAFTWCVALPLLAVGLIPVTHGASMALIALHAVPWVRASQHRMGQGETPRDAMLYASFCSIAKIANVVGAVRFAASRMGMIR